MSLSARETLIMTNFFLGRLEGQLRLDMIRVIKDLYKQRQMTIEKFIEKMTHLNVNNFAIIKIIKRYKGVTK